MAELDQAHESYELGMHTEQLSGRTQQVFFSAEESDNLVYPWAPEVDFDKKRRDRCGVAQSAGSERRDSTIDV